MIQLPQSIKDDISSAFVDQQPMLVCVATPEGEPSVSFRGTVSAISDSELGFWVRKADSTLVRSIAVNPVIVLVYANIPARRHYQFRGKARVTTDEEQRRVIFDQSPELERKQDPERQGIAIVVEVTSVTGRGAEGRIVLPVPVE